MVPGRGLDLGRATGPDSRRPGLPSVTTTAPGPPSVPVGSVDTWVTHDKDVSGAHEPVPVSTVTRTSDPPRGPSYYWHRGTSCGTRRPPRTTSTVTTRSGDGERRVSSGEDGDTTGHPNVSGHRKPNVGVVGTPDQCPERP